ncbi:hypothetical protein B0H16DRAFT_1776413 [Mycena metata]|uniref:Uncharacterized protein n=1 Tax=Mycena metata TaxID=1033252 RepID=A0AAD7HWQ3_9AGAR|nr:hypothetical protein B0H16DRAFT_1776413 [Mycena metata]
MSSLKRPPAHLPHDDNDTDDNDHAIDPELRLRTVCTAHSAIAESIVADARQTRRRHTFFRRRGEKEREMRLEGGRRGQRGGGGMCMSIRRCRGERSTFRGTVPKW